MNLKERMIEFIRSSDIDVKNFERHVGLSNGFVSHIGDSIRKKSIDLIVSKYPALNITWLLTGEGRMLKVENKSPNGENISTEENLTPPKEKSGNIKDTTTGSKPNPRLEALPISLASDPNDYDNNGERFEELPDGTIRMRIAIIPQKAFAGYLRGFQDPEYYEDMSYISIDVLKKHKGHYLAFEVKGDSMTTLEPEYFRQSIFDGWKVVGRELSRHQWAYKLHTHNYDAWVIVHKTEGILIKQITKHDVEAGVITIHSLNPDKNLYPDQDLHLDDIEQIFNVVKKVDD